MIRSLIFNQEGDALDFKLRPISANDREAVIDILNYYIENSFAAYPENKMPYEYFDTLIQRSKGYPTVVATDVEGKVLGYGVLRTYSPLPTFSKTAEIGYFIHPDYRRMGIGSAMLKFLIEGAKQKGINTILANISSKNQPSIAFHLKRGFTQVGYFQNIGFKKGEPFGMVWMQQNI